MEVNRPQVPTAQWTNLMHTVWGWGWRACHRMPCYETPRVAKLIFAPGGQRSKPRASKTGRLWGYFSLSGCFYNAIILLWLFKISTFLKDAIPLPMADYQHSEPFPNRCRHQVPINRDPIRPTRVASFTHFFAFFYICHTWHMSCPPQHGQGYLQSHPLHPGSVPKYLAPGNQWSPFPPQG